MAIFLFSQIVFKAESINVFIKGIGNLIGIQETFISKNKFRMNAILELKKEKLISKFMEKYYAGNKSIIIDLEVDSFYKIDNDEKIYSVYKIDSYFRPLEEIKSKKDIKGKLIIKDLKDCNYEFKFLFESDSIIAKICYKELTINQEINDFFINYNKKIQNNFDTRILERLGIFSVNNPFVNLLMSDIVKKSDLEKILKIKGYPYVVEIKYYNDTSLVYSYFSKVYQIKEVGNLDVFKIDSNYIRK
jgi:hypothetical protein